VTDGPGWRLAERGESPESAPPGWASVVDPSRFAQAAATYGPRMLQHSTARPIRRSRTRRQRPRDRARRCRSRRLGARDSRIGIPSLRPDLLRHQTGLRAAIAGCRIPRRDARGRRRARRRFGPRLAHGDGAREQRRPVGSHRRPHRPNPRGGSAGQSGMGWENSPAGIAEYLQFHSVDVHETAGV
jgi:hypothetical protein